MRTHFMALTALSLSLLTLSAAPAHAQDAPKPEKKKEGEERQRSRRWGGPQDSGRIVEMLEKELDLTPEQVVEILNYVTRAQ